MAGDWIKWVKGLAKRPEVLHMSTLLGRSRQEVAGLLMEFWEWADDNVCPADGASAECPGFVRILSASRPLVDGITGAPGFADAMTAVGWIVIKDDGLEFPKFGRHNGKSAKRRALDAERKKTGREVRPQSVREMSACDADKMRTREEKRREEEKDPPAPRKAGATRERKPRPANPLFDAIAEVTGADPKASGKHVGVIWAELAKAEPPYTPDEVREFSRRLAEFCPWAARDGRQRPTLGEVGKYIGGVRASPVKHETTIKTAADNPLLNY